MSTLLDLELERDFLELDAEVPPELEEQHRKELAQIIANTVAKRDAIGWVIENKAGKIQRIDEAINKLKIAKEREERSIERVKELALFAIRQLDKRDKEGAYLPLSGNLWELKAQRCPASVEIVEEEKVPELYRTVTITLTTPLGMMPALRKTGFDPDSDAWYGVKIQQSLNRRLILDALKKGDEVPGARLVTDKLRLEVR